MLNVDNTQRLTNEQKRQKQYTRKNNISRELTLTNVISNRSNHDLT